MASSLSQSHEKLTNALQPETFSFTEKETFNTSLEIYLIE